MARKKQDSSKQNVHPTTMTDSYGEWKKGDDVWYTSYQGEAKYGTIMYFSENSENEKKWVTLWDLTDPRYDSAHIETLRRDAPTKAMRNKVLKRIARAKIRNKKGK